MPVTSYTDQAQFTDELRLLRGRPQVVAASAELAAAGAYVSTDRLGVPILVTRTKSGTLKAFVNVCRHRGARIVARGTGRDIERFVCPYHSWAYDLDGSLRGIPQQFGFPTVDMTSTGLIQLDVVERLGLVWVVPDPSCAIGRAKTMIGTFASELDNDLLLASHFPFQPREVSIRCNWKLMIDASMEAYHFKVAHRNTIGALFANNLQLVDEFDEHMRFYLVKSNLSPEAPITEEAFDPRAYGNLLYFIFPNTFILVLPDYVQVFSFDPASPEMTKMHEVALLPKLPETATELGYWNRNIELYRSTIDEDCALAESIQQGLASGANTSLTFGRFEFASCRFHAQLRHEISRLENGDGVAHAFV